MTELELRSVIRHSMTDPSSGIAPSTRANRKRMSEIGHWEPFFT